MLWSFIYSEGKGEKKKKGKIKKDLVKWPSLTYSHHINRPSTSHFKVKERRYWCKVHRMKPWFNIGTGYNVLMRNNMNRKLKIAHCLMHWNVKCIQIFITLKLLWKYKRGENIQTLCIPKLLNFGHCMISIIDPISSKIRFTVLASYEITQKLLLYSSPGQ